jgi:hypothetical protein
MKSSLLAAWLISLTALLALSSISQNRYTLSGTIRNGETGEALIGATLMVKELPWTGVTSNAYGFYSLSFPEGSYTIILQYVGFRIRRDTLNFHGNRVINFALTPEPIKLEEVVVSGERSNANVTSTEIAANKLEVKEIQSVPVLLGEKDILKTIQLLPGIQSAGEGSTGFYARGGGTDQNLIVLDEAPIYNSSHLLGFLSVFNSDAIKDVKVMTGGIPAEYGGRLSSVLDIHTNDGNNKDFGGLGGIGLLASRLTLEGPIVKDQGSFLISGRRTYADLFFKLSRDTTINRSSLYFYDLNVKANYTLGLKDRLFLSGYFGRDNFNYPNAFGFNWGNTTGTLRWNHIFGDHLFSNTSLIFSDYEYSNIVGVGTSQFQITSGIQDENFKTDFQYYTDNSGLIKFGVNAIYHTFLPGKVTATTGGIINNTALENKFALENAAYLEHEIEMIHGVKVSYGLRYSVFNLLGPAHLYHYDEYGNVADTQTVASGSVAKTYSSLEPRLVLNILLNESSSLKTSYTRTAQYLHLLSNSTVSNPSDVWVPSTNNVKPQYADQVDAGYFRNFLDNEFEASFDVYYKQMHDVIDYKNGADLQINPTVEALLLYGTGRSYGAEFLLRRRAGRLSGWISYTLAKSETRFDLINNGRWFPARQDRTNDISIVAIYNYNSAWNFSATWVYYTGNAVTFPSGNYWLDGRLVPYYTERNGYRMPAYHRLDLAATWTLGPHSNLNFSLYNAYDRMNPYAIYFQQDPNDANRTQAIQTTFFPIIPSVTYNFNF